MNYRYYLRYPILYGGSLPDGPPPAGAIDDPETLQRKLEEVKKERADIIEFVKENFFNSELQEQIKEKKKYLSLLAAEITKLQLQIKLQKKKITPKYLYETGCESEENERDTLISWAQRFGDKKWTELYNDKPIIVIAAHGNVISSKITRDKSIFDIPENTQLISMERSGTLGRHSGGREVDPITNNGKTKVSMFEDILKSSMNPHNESLYLLENNGITRKPPFLYPHRIYKKTTGCSDSSSLTVACQKLYREGDAVNNISYNFNDHNDAFLYYYYDAVLLASLMAPPALSPDMTKIAPTVKAAVAVSGKSAEEIATILQLDLTVVKAMLDSPEPEPEPRLSVVSTTRARSASPIGSSGWSAALIAGDDEHQALLAGTAAAAADGTALDIPQEFFTNNPNTLTGIHIFNSQYPLEHYIDRLYEKRTQFEQGGLLPPGFTPDEFLKLHKRNELINTILDSPAGKARIAELEHGPLQRPAAATVEKIGTLPSNNDKHNFSFNISNGETNLYDIMQLLGEGTYYSVSCKALNEAISDEDAELVRVISQKRHIPAEVIGKEAGFWYY